MRECQAFGAIDFCLWQGQKADAPPHGLSATPLFGMTYWRWLGYV
jgi:hypothetical protein